MNGAITLQQERKTDNENDSESDTVSRIIAGVENQSTGIRAAVLRRMHEAGDQTAGAGLDNIQPSLLRKGV